MRGCYKIVCWPFRCYFKQYYLFIRFWNTLSAEFDKRMYVSSRNVWMEAKTLKTKMKYWQWLCNKISLLILLTTRLTGVKRNRNPRLPPPHDIVYHNVISSWSWTYGSFCNQNCAWIVRYIFVCSSIIDQIWTPRQAIV